MIRPGSPEHRIQQVIGHGARAAIAGGLGHAVVGPDGTVMALELDTDRMAYVSEAALGEHIVAAINNAFRTARNAVNEIARKV
ncbi:hypothetical protein ACFQ1S_10135 [Kibdelosporangium lantanae]|uniref:Roadblock/LAMTOR2 domain-containing protein n=1 Tax=Kibdelosporangium lantanae TaxID=1497396 RepID=A0ABW3M7B3_9PSEU